jgi:hypothetical protein
MMLEIRTVPGSPSLLYLANVALWVSTTAYELSAYEERKVTIRTEYIADG